MLIPAASLSLYLLFDHCYVVPEKSYCISRRQSNTIAVALMSHETANCAAAASRSFTFTIMSSCSWSNEKLHGCAVLITFVLICSFHLDRLWWQTGLDRQIDRCLSVTMFDTHHCLSPRNSSLCGHRRFSARPIYWVSLFAYSSNSPTLFTINAPKERDRIPASLDEKCSRICSFLSAPILTIIVANLTWPVSGKENWTKSLAVLIVQKALLIHRHHCVPARVALGWSDFVDEVIKFFSHLSSKTFSSSTDRKREEARHFQYRNNRDITLSTRSPAR